MLTLKQIHASRKRAAVRALAGLGPVVEGSLCRASRGTPDRSLGLLPLVADPSGRERNPNPTDRVKGF